MGFIFEYYNKASSADKDQNMILINSLSFEVRNSKEGGGGDFWIYHENFGSQKRKCVELTVKQVVCKTAWIQPIKCIHCAG